MNGRIGAGIAVAVALVAVLWLFMQVRVQRAMAQVEAERDAAEVARQQAEQKGIAGPRQPLWEYRVVSVAGNDDAVNQAIGKLTAERWEYVGVTPPSGPLGVYPRLLFKRMKLAAEIRAQEATAAQPEGIREGASDRAGCPLEGSPEAEARNGSTGGIANSSSARQSRTNATGPGTSPAASNKTAGSTAGLSWIAGAVGASGGGSRGPDAGRLPRDDFGFRPFGCVLGVADGYPGVDCGNLSLVYAGSGIGRGHS
jgi:hypothetical protein